MMESTDSVIIQDISQTLGIPMVEIENEDGLVQLEFENSGLFTIEPAPEHGGAHISLAKKIDYFSTERQGLRLLTLSCPDANHSFRLKIGMMNEGLVVLCVFLTDDEFSVQSIFEVLDFLRDCMYDLVNSS